MTISTQTLAGKKPVQTKLSTKTWTVEAVAELYDLPFNDLLYRAHEIQQIVERQVVQIGRAHV